MSEPDILTQLREAELACEKTLKPLGSVFKAAADEIERLRGALEEIWQVAAYDDCEDRAAREWIEVHARDYLDAKEAQSDV